MKPMRRIFFGLIMIWVLVALGGCGGDDDDDDFDGGPVVIDLFSDPAVDGYIRDPANSSIRAVTIGATSVFAGVHPITSDEYRGFLDFPLEGVPFDAAIDSAYLEIYIRSFQSQAATFPLLIELVDFEPPLIASDFDRNILLPLRSMVVTVASSDVNRIVRIDVTPLMAEAQRLGLPSFQVRLLQDPASAFAGLAEIDDSDDEQRAPLLTVAYF